ncbi:unnamed protein product [Sphagnum troendelagicum]
MVNLLQRMNSGALVNEATTILKNAHVNDNSDRMLDQDNIIMPEEDDASTSESEASTDGSEHCEWDSHQLKQVNCEDEFKDTEFEDLVASSNHDGMNTRWREICQRIRVDTGLDKEKQPQLWEVLERYQDVFAWNKGELGCCTIGEHFVDTQGFPPCRVSPSRLCYWEEAEVKRHIDVLVDLGKMKPSNSEYACRRKRPHYYDKQQQLELVLAAQRLFESGEHDLNSVDPDEEDECGANSRNNDIWDDVTCMDLLQGGMLPATVDLVESKRARKRILNYHWQGQSLDNYITVYAEDEVDCQHP